MRCRDKLRVMQVMVMEGLMLSPVTKRSRVQATDECPHQPLAWLLLSRLRMLIVDSCVEGDHVYYEQRAGARTVIG